MDKIDFPKVSVYIAMSIDGYIAQKDNGLKWLDGYHLPGEDFGHKKFYDSIDLLILGRKTYDVVSSFDDWPYKDKRVIVISKTLPSVREGVELYRGEPKDLLVRLGKEGVQHLWLDGGITISKFLEAGLVDEMIITVIPALLGSGIPLFNERNQGNGCTLLSSQAYPNGLVQLHYALT